MSDGADDPAEALLVLVEASIERAGDNWWVVLRPQDEDGSPRSPVRVGPFWSAHMARLALTHAVKPSASNPAPLSTCEDASGSPPSFPENPGFVAEPEK